jgi:ribonuclease HI
MRPTAGITTDAAHSMKNGLTQYRGVDLATGAEIFRKDLGNMTVNAGEFLGVVAAVRYIIENSHSPAVIYTDSLTAIAWFRGRKTASKKRISALFKAEVFLQFMAAEIERIDVRHWDNELWGETPADFNHK